MLIEPSSLAVLGGAIALGGGLLGSAIGIATAASAGTATLSEDRGQFRNVIVLSSLPMTQSFYGLIVTIIILTSVVPNLPDLTFQSFNMRFLAVKIIVLFFSFEVLIGEMRGQTVRMGVATIAALVVTAVRGLL